MYSLAGISPRSSWIADNRYGKVAGIVLHGFLCRICIRICVYIYIGLSYMNQAAAGCMVTMCAPASYIAYLVMAYILTNQQRDCVTPYWYCGAIYIRILHTIKATDTWSIIYYYTYINKKNIVIHYIFAVINELLLVRRQPLNYIIRQFKFSDQVAFWWGGRGLPLPTEVSTYAMLHTIMVKIFKIAYFRSGLFN